MSKCAIIHGDMHISRAIFERALIPDTFATHYVISQVNERKAVVSEAVRKTHLLENLCVESRGSEGMGR